jgi:hypothetical protein
VSRVTVVYFHCELDVQFKRTSALVQGLAGGPICISFFCAAMGFHSVADLSEYSVAELLHLIEQAVALVWQKLRGKPTDPVPSSILPLHLDSLSWGRKCLRCASFSWQAIA